MRLAAWLILVTASCAGAASPRVSSVPDELRTQYDGRIVVLDFWAGWCAQCRDTVPQLRRLAAAFPTDRLVVVGVNVGEDPETARDAARDLGITYPILFDEDLVLSDRVGATQLPLLLVVNGDGAIVHRARKVDAATLAVLRRLVARSSANEAASAPAPRPTDLPRPPAR